MSYNSGFTVNDLAYDIFIIIYSLTDCDWLIRKMKTETICQVAQRKYQSL